MRSPFNANMTMSVNRRPRIESALSPGFQALHCHLAAAPDDGLTREDPGDERQPEVQRDALGDDRHVEGNTSAIGTLPFAR